MASLKELCKSRDLSLTELSKRTGIGLPQLSRIENGKANPRKKTLEKIADVLRIDVETLRGLFVKNKSIDNTFDRWLFLKGLDSDLKSGLLQKLISTWTHHSTSLEGNTISEGDTHLILTEGLTISGKSLLEHQEVYGHGSAVRMISQMLAEGHTLTVQRCHELHKLIQTQLIFDIFKPIGKFKVEVNGTQALKSNGDSFWHTYSDPIHVPYLMDKWMEQFKTGMHPIDDKNKALDIYTELHLWLTAIHPYADGNGRLARLLSNIPLLRSGFAPLIIHKEARREYLGLLGNHGGAYPSPSREVPYLQRGAEMEALRSFFKDQWEKTYSIIEEFRENQDKRLK